MNAQVVVIGGGISGLACAYRLWQLGVPVTLLEADDRVGGLIGTVEQEGFLFETGPQSFQGTDSVLDLVRELGLEVDLCQADLQAPRYVVRRGRLEKLPCRRKPYCGVPCWESERGGESPQRPCGQQSRLPRKNRWRNSCGANLATRYSNISSRRLFPACMRAIPKNLACAPRSRRSKNGSERTAAS